MKGTDLDRLLRSAAKVGEPALNETPFGLDTRVVATWRSGASRNELADLSRFLRSAGMIACAVVIVAGAAAYRQYRDETNFAALATNEYVIADLAIQTELSQ
jgi:hypothetical protein